MSEPTVFNIPTGAPFADALAAGIIDRFGTSPDALADVLVLMPNRRAIRALGEAFLRVSAGAPLILPEMRPLGEIEDEAITAITAFSVPGADAGLPPPINQTRRLAMLTRLIALHPAMRASVDGDSQGTSVRLAAELARFMDQVETEELSFDALVKLVPDLYAKHWQETIDFLEIATTNWPKILSEIKASNPADHRVKLLNQTAEAWDDNAPDRTIIAAGSTGSIPATARLLKVIARLPNGQVVLPGLDTEIPDEIWDQIKADPCHPQTMMARLLDIIGTRRDLVEPWPLRADHKAAVEAARPRISLLGQALYPAPATANWRDADKPPGAATAGLRLVETPGTREEATVIAMILREALETPGKRATLITPDRGLARRVRAVLGRWGVEVDDSGGTPLALAPAATFLGLILEAVIDKLNPVALLSLLKHPYCACGLERGAFLKTVRLLEAEILRGPRPGPGLAGLKAAADGSPKPVVDLVARLTERLSPIEDLFQRDQAGFRDILAAQLAAAEALADTDTGPGAATLWRGQDGETLASHVEDLALAADDFGTISPSAYPGMWNALLGGQVIRPRWGGHPRLNIWGTIEARLQDADLVVLGSLNEGSWPPAAADDPWMSRPMRKEFGLPSPERRIGQSAHDFVQALGVGEVVMTRSRKVDGTPTVPSRWLSRLHALAGPLAGGSHPWLHWVDGLDDRGETAPLPPPRPTPPLAARPAKLSVTAIQQWMRDPYALYARRILRLEPLDPLDQAPGAADRGIILHQALENFLEENSGKLPGDALERLIATGKTAFGPAMTRPAVWAFWWPRFIEIATAFIEVQEGRSGSHKIIGNEIKGELEINGTAAPFTLTAIADRIDQTTGKDGTLEIIDYKTGIIPTGPQIRAGFAPQLPLEGLIAEAGGFEGVPALPVSGLAFWKLQGGDKPVAIKWPRDLPAEEVIGDAGAGLRRLIDAFADEKTPYLSKPRPAITGANIVAGDYDHLARIDEWLATLGKDAGEDETP